MGRRTRTLKSTEVAAIAGQVAGILRHTVVRRPSSIFTSMLTSIAVT